MASQPATRRPTWIVRAATQTVLGCCLASLLLLVFSSLAGAWGSPLAVASLLAVVLLVALRHRGHPPGRRLLPRRQPGEG